MIQNSPAIDFHLTNWKNNLVAIAALAVAYFGAGKVGLSMAFVHPSSTAVWPPSGIALAAFLILGYRVWPGIFLGAFLVNLTTLGTVLTSLGVATGNTLEGLLGAYLVIRFANGRACFNRVQDTFKFALLAGMIATMVAATFGFTTLALGGFAPWADYKSIWLTWWMGDASGVIVIAPLLILWSLNPTVRWSWSRLCEFTFLVISIMLTAHVVFGPFILSGVRNYPLEYLCIPFLIWVAFRFGPREAATVTAILSPIAVWGSLYGFGPFAIGTKNESLLLLQTFMCVVAVMTMALAVTSAERLRAEEQVYSLAVTDPLTGLANYRKLVDVLDLELRRFARTGRSFAVLLLDMDELKSINDSYGHVKGSRALVRLGDILRVYCRDIDTAARYGGDEFALVMSEAGAAEAQQVAARIRQRVAQDLERPALSVSVGAAVCPRDGETREALLEAADRALYEMKRLSHEQMHLSSSSSEIPNEL
jgi:diguanylate cyclase (GGDEF)-like protein